MPLVRSPSRMLLPAICAVATAIASPACRDKPQELPEPAPTAQAMPAVAPLIYEVPGTWTKMGESTVNARRAGFKVPKAGADSEEAEVSVLFYGTGSQGDADKVFKDWFGDWD